MEITSIVTYDGLFAFVTIIYLTIDITLKIILEIKKSHDKNEK